jgi:predicted Zn-dependent peptidase
MQNLYAVPWRNPARRILVRFLVAAILVFSIFALLKTNTGDKQAPAPKELLASNSVERPPAVRSSASNDQMAAFLAPALTQPVPKPVQSAAVDLAALIHEGGNF